MKPDRDGFLRPALDAARCRDCGACARACPVLTPVSPAPAPLAVWAARTRDAEELASSSSGGLFSLAARKILGEGGSVFGCVWRDDAACHVRADDAAGAAAMRGSKYVQSDPRATYRECREVLAAGRPVLYTGTPCQIAGLRQFLGRDWPGLVTIALICHGVPSPKVLDAFLQDLVREAGASSAPDVRFRVKDPSWSRSRLRVTFDTGVVHDEESFASSYMRMFLMGFSARESCSVCRFRSGRAGADLVIGDFWGVETTEGLARFRDDRGASAVLAFTERGLRFAEALDLDRADVTYDEVARLNFNLDHDTRPPLGRRRFLSHCAAHGFSAACAHALADSPLKRWLRSVYKKLRGGGR